MVKVLLIMHHIALCTPCIILHFAPHALLLVYYTCTFVLDPTEPKPEELQEPAPVEDANPEQEQGKPRCIKPHSLSFIYLYILFMIFECALDHRS
jgi:hypothetical protein